MQAVIFDMDGVLIDSETVAFRAYQQACAELGLPFQESFFELFKGKNGERNVELLTERFGSNELATQIRARRIDLGAEIIEQEGLQAIAGARELLSFLRDSSIPVAVATSTVSERAKEHLKSVGLLDFFSFLIGGEEVKEGKPHPEIFLRAAAGLGIAPEHCIVIEDSIFGIEAAERAKMKSVFFSSSTESIQKVKGKATHLVTSLAEAREVIKSYLSPGLITNG